jgi:Trk K+ transport system NAD-binding subunit/Kef-type K+ transport system membrane component KefB
MNQDLLIYIGSFVVIAVASHQIGHFLGRYRLPHITGYLLAGVIAGPFVFGLLPTGASDELRFIDELSLAVIAFVAGSELYIKELRSRLKSIMLNTMGVLVAAFILNGIVLFLLTEFIPFAQSFNTGSRIAVGLLGSTVLLALSPASTIAVIKEVRAKGPFTKLVLSVTVVMDVVIIVLFALTAALADGLLSAIGFEATFVFALVLDLVAALVTGVVVGMLLERILSARIHYWVKVAAVLLLGMMIFAGGYALTDVIKEQIGLEVHFEPLLVAMLGGFYVTNFSAQREQFDSILHDIGPAVYVAFFTLTGISLKLDVLTATIGIAVLLFLVRIVAIGAGSFIGGTVAGESLKTRRIVWLGLITQAGIALGLAREVAVEFPRLGDEFATLIVSVVVLNEIFGPLFLKYALRQAGEATVPEEPGRPDEVREAVIFGIEGQSIALARQLRSQNWRVSMVDSDCEQVDLLASEEVTESCLSALDEDGIAAHLSSSTDAVIAMLPDDEINFLVCDLAAARFGIKRLVVRVNDLALEERFKTLGALVIDPANAMIALLDRAVRVPDSAARILNQDPRFEKVLVTVNEPDMDGQLVRDLRLPPDVLILSVRRNGDSLLANGYTELRLGDEVTLLGSPQNLRDVTLRLGY